MPSPLTALCPPHRPPAFLPKLISPLDAYDDAAGLHAALQRDLNALSDEGVAVRRASLQRLSQCFFGRDLSQDPEDAPVPGTASSAVATGGAVPVDAIDGETRGVTALPSEYGQSLLREVLPDLTKPLLKRFADPSDTCRQLAADLVRVHMAVAV
jgi:hypothetical protein